ncbi:CbtA family protein [Mycobacteroides salmoniphilum]|uniref:CbtA family protein n=1 Tax=Mycobacteroides salmoniphilum TaxID=404941 RepID=UPI001064BC32|nr:CbtA family protein [Mycobacteroides salmoniphilum]TDZ80547.1 putative cobalt transporter subunit (CbtA) [Mycobacteroides salmoniphilum]TDZ88047.1 putative cobalt transporter subunit (CbtA) [Mycobacteroides salmoniphilum]
MNKSIASIILRALGFGALGGALAFVFGRIAVEPIINRAIGYEEGRGEAQHGLDEASGMHQHGHEGAELFTRTVQENVGLFFGMLLFGLAMGALFAVVYTVAIGRLGNLAARNLALVVSGGMFLALYVTPFLKYPPNPPAASAEETIKERTGLYLLMVVISIAALVAAIWLSRRLADRYGNWTANIIAGKAYIIVTVLVMLVLPNIAETPGPLLDAAGNIVFPSFPAQDLYLFRLYSFIAQAIIWVTIGIGFATVIGRKPVSAEASVTG